MDLDSLIAKVQEKVGALIQKPKMTEKLLSKPPFRFLHDTISAIISTTGFGEGLYNDAEKDSATITEKQQKLDYLDKIFRLVGICQVINKVNVFIDTNFYKNDNKIKILTTYIPYINK